MRNAHHPHKMQKEAVTNGRKRCSHLGTNQMNKGISKQSREVVLMISDTHVNPRESSISSGSKRSNSSLITNSIGYLKRRYLNETFSFCLGLTHRNSWFSIRSSYSSNPNSTLEKPIIRYLKETTARISSKLR